MNSFSNILENRESADTGLQSASRSCFVNGNNLCYFHLVPFWKDVKIHIGGSTVASVTLLTVHLVLFLKPKMLYISCSSTGLRNIYIMYFCPINMYSLGHFWSNIYKEFFNCWHSYFLKYWGWILFLLPFLIIPTLHIFIMQIQTKVGQCIAELSRVHRSFPII